VSALTIKFAVSSAALITQEYARARLYWIQTTRNENYPRLLVANNLRCTDRVSQVTYSHSDFALAPENLRDVIQSGNLALRAKP